MEIVYDELQEVIGSGDNPEDKVQLDFVVKCINEYLRTLPKLHRMIFVGRYWRFDSIEYIAKHLGITQGRTKTILCRTRKGLKEFLEKEGILV